MSDATSTPTGAVSSLGASVNTSLLERPQARSLFTMLAATLALLLLALIARRRVSGL
jgi:hypothetical protein